MSSERPRPSTPPPANTMVILAGDLLATRASELLDQLACGQWAPARKLRDALRTYSEVRIGTTMSEQANMVLRQVESSDPQAMNIADWQPPADCAGRTCKHFGRCNHATGDDCFEARARVDEPAALTERSVQRG